MLGKRYELQRNTSDRLRRLIASRLDRLDITPEEAARQTRLPSHAFRAFVSTNKRTSLDRADELCRALNLTFTIGADESAGIGRGPIPVTVVKISRKPYRLQRDVTERLKAAVNAELKRLDITREEAARQASIPSHVFRTLLLKSRRPSLDRADELCRAVDLAFTVGYADDSGGD